MVQVTQVAIGVAAVAVGGQALAVIMAVMPARRHGICDSVALLLFLWW